MRALLSGIAAWLCTACHNPSKLDRTPDVILDELWALAPANTRSAIVASPRAVELTLDALDAVRALRDDAELAPLVAQADLFAEAALGSRTASRQDAGLGAGEFALFRAADAIVAVLPVVDRGKFVAAMHGQRDGTNDIVAGFACTTIANRYTCAAPAAALQNVGRTSIISALPAHRARGDAEIFIADQLGPSHAHGTAAIALRFERGALTAEADWFGPLGPLSPLLAAHAPGLDVTGLAAFATVDLSATDALVRGNQLRLGDVSVDQWLASVRGPAVARVPAGTTTLDIRVDLADTGPTTRVIESCEGLPAALRPERTTAGVCRVQLPLVPPVDLELWLDAGTLHAANHRDASVRPGTQLATPRAERLASGGWLVALWARGTAMSVNAVPTDSLSAEAALGVRIAALINELGVGARLTPDGVHVEAYVRTAWANPPAIADAYVRVTARDIQSGRGKALARELVANANDAPLAGDLAAGPGGLVVTSSMTLAAVAALPELVRLLLGIEEPAQPPETAFQQREATSDLVRSYVYDAFGTWRAVNTKDRCPPSLDALAAMKRPPLATRDVWGHALGLDCNDHGIIVWSLGPDGERGTADDIGSTQPL